MISVVIPLYNKELYIKNTIQNVLNQTFKGFEVIVVNDGSKDSGSEIVKSFKDSRIKLIEKENGGVSSARNLGIKNAKFNYIAFLDADDEWENNHLQEIANLINDYGEVADVFVTNFSRKYNTNKIINNRNFEELERGIVNDYFREALRKAVIHTSCVCISKKSLEDINGFNEKISRGEDIDVWMKLARKFKIAYSPIITENYLQEAENNSSRKFDISKSIVYHLNFIDYKNPIEKKFFIRMLWRKYTSLLLKDRDLINFLKLIKKQGIKF